MADPTSHEKAVAQIEERRRAETRAKLCKSRVSREPIPGKPDAFAVRVDGREVGLLRHIVNADWSAVYLENGADLYLGTWHGKAVALGRDDLLDGDHGGRMLPHPAVRTATSARDSLAAPSLRERVDHISGWRP